MSRLKASEMSPKQLTGRRNKHRGYTTEKQLEKFLNSCGIPAERVMMSGALKGIKHDDLHGDVNIKLGDKLVRVEVKSRVKLPRYVTNLYKDRDTHEVKKLPREDRVIKVQDLCYILDQDQFLELMHIGTLPRKGATIGASRCGALEEWFKQDDSQIVAMKEFGKRTWYFAVHIKAVNKVGGKF